MIFILKVDEQEVCINFMRDEDFATVYCSDSTWITKMDKLVKKSPDLFKIVSETDFGKTYRFPKKLISIRSSFKKMTDEQRDAVSERLKIIRDARRL